MDSGSKHWIEVSGSLAEDISTLSKIESPSEVTLTNTSIALKTLGVPTIHCCFVELSKLFPIKKVVLNVADNLPALYAGIKLGYHLKHNFTSERLKGIISLYSLSRTA